jgi:hypothetical protein
MSKFPKIVAIIMIVAGGIMIVVGGFTYYRSRRNCPTKIVASDDAERSPVRT